MIDMEKLNGILNIVLLSSLLSLTAAFFSLWFLSKWAEIKEMLKNLTEKIEQKLTAEIKNEKLTSLYVKEEPINQTSQNQTEQTTLPAVIFAEDVTDKETIISKYKTVKITTTEPTTTTLVITEPTTTETITTEPTTTSKPKTLEETSQEIKDIIKKRKTKNETSK